MLTSTDQFRSADAYHLLMEQVIAGNGLSAIARLLADLLGLPATVSDDRLEPLYGFVPRGRRLSIEESALPAECRAQVSFDLSVEPQASTMPPTGRCRDTEGQEYAVAPIVLPVGIVGYVWAVDPSGRLSPSAETTVREAAAACAVEMVRQRAIAEGAAGVRNSFLEDLLSGRFRSSNSMRRRAQFLGYDLRGPQVVFVIDLDQFSPYLQERDLDESQIQRLKDRFRRSLDGALPALWSDVLVWEHSDSLVILAPADTSDPAVLGRRVEAIRETVERRMADGPTVSAGIGRVYEELTDLPLSYHEAEHALEISASIHGRSTTSSFEDLGPYRLLFHLRDHGELTSFCEEMLGPLQRYDDAHGTQLLRTLAAYLDHEGSISETSQALHMHRNGLLYRLARIREITGYALDSPMQRLALRLALLALPLVNGD